MNTKATEVEKNQIRFENKILNVLHEYEFKYVFILFH